MTPTIWSTAVLGGRRAWVVGWTIVALTLFVLAIALFFAVNAQPTVRMIGCALPLAALLMFYWLRYVPGAVRQNSPANARLVPGLHRAVRRATVLAWCLTLVPLAVIASAFKPAALVFVMLGAMVTSIGMARGGSATGSVIYVLLSVVMAMMSTWSVRVDWLSTPQVLSVLYLLVAALAWEGLRTVFPSGGERHWKLLPEQEDQRARDNPQLAMRRDRGRGLRASLYAMLLRRDLRPGARPGHVLLHALGPGNHRFDFALPLLLVVLLAIVVKLALPALELNPGTAPIKIICLLAVSLLPLQGPNFQRLVDSMNNTPVEQALVRLAPRAPLANQLGPMLARQMLRICLSEWLACGAGALALMLLFGGGTNDFRLLATLQCASLAMAGWALRDYSGQNPGTLVAVIVQSVLVAGAGIALFLTRENVAVWSVLMVLLLGVACAIIHGRWNTMTGAPAPFPAGRFA